MSEAVRTIPVIVFLILVLIVIPIWCLTYIWRKARQPYKGMRIRIVPSIHTGLSNPISEDFVGLLGTVEEPYLPNNKHFFWVTLDEQPDLDLVLHKTEMERVKA